MGGAVGGEVNAVLTAHSSAGFRSGRAHGTTVALIQFLIEINPIVGLPAAF